MSKTEEKDTKKEEAPKKTAEKKVKSPLSGRDKVLAEAKRDAFANARRDAEIQPDSTD